MTTRSVGVVRSARVSVLAFAALLLASCTAVLGDGTYYIPVAAEEADAGGDSSGEGTIDAPVAEDGCASGAPGACGECAPGTRRCTGKSVQTCSASGRWSTSSNCPYICTGAGVCAGECVVGASQCAGKGVQKCDGTATWQDSQSCSFGCQSGACTGACVPGATQCSGVLSQTCDNAGTWQTTTTCSFVCSGTGTCSGVCSPGSTQCSGSTPQTCDATGAWNSLAACAQPTPDCQSGACTCLEATCNGGSTCANIQTDSHNCGSCGHDCQMAAAASSPVLTCQAGICQPATLASGQSAPWGIAVNGASVFWTNTGDGTVKSIPISGAGPVVAVATGPSDPMSIAVDAANVYWVAYAKGAASSGAVLKCPIAGCGSTPTSLASMQSGPWGIAIDATAAYFTAGPSVFKTLSGDAGAPVPLGTDGTHAGYAIAVDATSVYWTDAVGGILKCAIGGCGTPTTIGSAVAQQPSYGLALDGTNVYGSNQSGTIWRVSKMGMGVNAAFLASGQSGPLGVAVDATNVYWTNNTGGTVMKCAVGGCSSSGPSTVATGQSGPAGIAVDATNVYWVNQTAGTIMKLAK